MNRTTDATEVDPLAIPESLKRAPKLEDKVTDEPIEVERQFVTIETEGGIPVTKE